MNTYKSLYAISKFNHLKDYYQVLNISKTNDQSTIKKAYYALAKKFHPDVNQGKEDKFKEVNEAYEVLSDENIKKEYDQARNPQPNTQQSQTTYQNRKTSYSQQHYQQQQRQQQQYSYNEQNSQNFEEILRKAQEHFYQQQDQRYKRYEEERQQYENVRRQEEEEQNSNYKQQYSNFDEFYKSQYKRKTFYSQQEKQAYEEFVRQREYEERMKERFEEWKQKGQGLAEGFTNISKNLGDIKTNFGNIWDTLRGKNNR